MNVKKYKEEDIKGKINLEANVSDSVAKITTAPGSYITIASGETGIPEADIANLESFNTTYAKAAVSKLGDTLAETYNNDKSATSFEANIDFTNGSISGKGERVTTGSTKMDGVEKPWTSTGFVIKHESPKLEG